MWLLEKLNSPTPFAPEKGKATSTPDMYAAIIAAWSAIARPGNSPDTIKSSMKTDCVAAGPPGDRVVIKAARTGTQNHVDESQKS